MKHTLDLKKFKFVHTIQTGKWVEGLKGANISEEEFTKTHITMCECKRPSWKRKCARKMFEFLVFTKWIKTDKEPSYINKKRIAKVV